MTAIMPWSICSSVAASAPELDLGVEVWLEVVVDETFVDADGVIWVTVPDDDGVVLCVVLIDTLVMVAIHWPPFRDFIVIISLLLT